MKRSDIDKFFKLASTTIEVPVKVYLTGGVASWFWGGTRPTDDIDFALKVAESGVKDVEAVFYETSRLLSIPIEFSTDINRWGMIELPAYERTSKFYKKYGKVSVYFLDVASWSVGKLGRYYEHDRDDLIKVFIKQKPSFSHLAKIWGKALKLSPHSTSQILFKRMVENFLRNYGQRIWGKQFNSEKVLGIFYKEAAKKT